MRTSRRLSADKKKLLDPSGTPALRSLWVYWYEKTKGRAYSGDAQHYELAMLKQALQHYSPLQVAYAITSWLKDWPYPTLVSFCQWLIRDVPFDEVFRDPLQARAYFLFEMTGDRDLGNAMQRFDEAEAGRSWGHNTDVEGARNVLEQVCNQVTG